MVAVLMVAVLIFRSLFNPMMYIHKQASQYNSAKTLDYCESITNGLLRCNSNQKSSTTTVSYRQYYWMSYHTLEEFLQ